MRVASQLGTKRQVPPPCLKPLYHSIQCTQSLTHLLCHKCKHCPLLLLKEARTTLKTYSHPKLSNHKHHPYKDLLFLLPLKRNKSCPPRCHPVMNRLFPFHLLYISDSFPIRQVPGPVRTASTPDSTLES